MGYQYKKSTRWVKRIVVIILKYGALAIFLLFCDHQDNESK